MIHKAVLDACDALDGVKDGLIENPARASFDPKVLQCKGADGPDCLTPPQVETASKITRRRIREPAPRSSSGSSPAASWAGAG